MNIFNKRWLTVWLLPLSLLFRLAVYLRNLLYEFNLLPIVKLNVPVISVGNLTVGGTGKTPAVEYIARLLLSNHLRPAVVTRGYGRRQRGTVVVSNGKQICAEVEASGDEAMQLAKRLKGVVIIADEKKHRGAQYASENFQIDAVIIDDGFQHRRLQRDCDMVLIDAPSFFANRWLLPAGPFREPCSALQRAHLIIFANADKASSKEISALSALSRTHSSALVFKSRLAPQHFENMMTGERLPPALLEGKKIFAACGIAQPSRFFDELTRLEAQVVGRAAFPDHHAFTKEQITTLLEQARAAGAEAMVITEKDATKWIQRLGPTVLPVFFLSVKFILTGDAEAFEAKMLERCRKASGGAVVNL